MINCTNKEAQSGYRDKYFAEFQSLVDEYGIKPTIAGPHALIRILEIEEKSQGGIIVQSGKDIRGEHERMRVGMVVDFGPTALAGYELPGDKKTKGPKDYGICIGDFVEYDRHAGRLCSYKQFEKYRVLAAEDLYTVYKEV